jgi:hypothetical protein
MAEPSTRIVDRTLSVPATMTPTITSVPDGLHYPSAPERSVTSAFENRAGELVTLQANERGFEEPSMGPSPELRSQVFDALPVLHTEGLTIPLNKQNAPWHSNWLTGAI